MNQLGIHPTRTDIIQDGSNLVVRLTDTLVAKVLQDKFGPRTSFSWFQKEIDISLHLAQVGAPVVPPHKNTNMNTFVHDEYPISFWEFVESNLATILPSSFGVTLKQCHDALQNYRGDLQSLAILYESIELLNSQSYFDNKARTLLCHHLKVAVGTLSACCMQPLHGDAHLGNFLSTDRGLLLTDWEDAFIGPIEWDLASMIWNAKVLEQDNKKVAAMLGGYGTYSCDILYCCLKARAAAMSTWYPILYPNPSSERQIKLEYRLKWLSDNT